MGHSIGGFTENFSGSKYFCRYCKITRTEFENNDPDVCGPQCTPEVYDSAINVIASGDGEDDRGIKVNSVFNALKSFLPLCLGHDIFEGVLSYDVALYLK